MEADEAENNAGREVEETNPLDNIMAQNNGAVQNRGPLREALNFHGHFYILNKRKSGMTYYICQYHESRACPGRGVVRRNGQFSITVDHTHSVNLRTEQELSFRRELYNSIRSQPNSPREVYNSLRNLHGNAEMGIPFQSIQGSMSRWRRENVPTEIPRDLNSFAAIINSGNWSRLSGYVNGSLQFNLVTGEDFSCILILDPNFASPLLAMGDFLVHVSNTAVPSSVWCKQLITIMCSKDNYAVPSAWILMNSDSVEAYNAVLERLRNIVPGFVMNTVLTNFSHNLHTSIRQQFPAVTISGSLFHYQEEVQKMALMHGLSGHLLQIEETEIKLFLHNIFALPLLPAGVIEETFREMVQDISEDSSRVLGLFILDFDRFWISGVTPEEFCVKSDLKRITEVFEHYSNQLQTKIGITPAVWQFTAGIASLQSQVSRDNGRLSDGIRINLNLIKILNLRKSTRIRQAWNELDDNSITLFEFLQRACYIFTEPLSEYFNVYLERNTQAELIQLINRNNDFQPVPDQEIPENANRAEMEEAVDVAENPDNSNGVENGEVENTTCSACHLVATHCFMPCGHLTFCENCCSTFTEDAERNACPMCRQNFTFIQRIIIEPLCRMCGQGSPEFCFIPCGHLSLCSPCYTEYSVNAGQNICVSCPDAYTSG